MNLRKVLDKSALIVPQKIAESGEKPESLSPVQIEKISLSAIRIAINSVLPDAEANHIGGQKFPDITVTLDGETDGVEVKSTRTMANPWTVPGGSIMEGNRVDGVNDVWLLFTKLAERVETRARPYSDAVCDLAVTHSPRYILSMESKRENSLFAKLGITYDSVRASEHPFDFFRDYLEQKARETGGTPWWFEREPEAVAPPFIRFWEDLDEEEKSGILAEGWALFAKDLLFGSTRDKYKTFALHLVRKYAIISTSLRDKFTAGGQEVVIEEFGKSPRVFLSFANMLPKIRNLVLTGVGEDSRSWELWKAKILNSAKAKANGELQFHLLIAIFREYL
jgi:hypothetical protein